MRDRLRWLLSAIFGGGTFVSFKEGNPWAGVALALLLAAVAFTPEPIFMHRFRAGAWAGLTHVIPVNRLDRARVLAANVARRRAATAQRALSTAMTGMMRADLLLCSGFQIIGNSEHPGALWDALATLPPNATLRVLLLDPQSPAGRVRSQAVMRQQHRRYADGVHSVMWTLRRLHEDKGVDVQLRLYTDAPIWQMIILPTEIWVLVSADGRSTEESPIYLLRRDGKFSLAYGFLSVWDRRWNHPDTRIVNLASITAPDWSNVKALPKRLYGQL